MSLLLNLHDYEREAASKLDSNALEYFRGGAADEITLRRNQTAFQEIVLRPRVLQDVSERSLQTLLLGQPFSMPIGIAPTAMQRLAHDDGEHATARAASSLNVPMILSTTSTVSVDDIGKVEGLRWWFQVYVYKDREATRELALRAKAAGATALVLTVDTPYLGKREGAVRAGFHLPAHLSLPNYAAVGATGVPHTAGESSLGHHFSLNIEDSLTWNDVLWLKEISGLPMIVKGVLRADDAILAVQHGVAGIIISNHGGRQLDTAQATIDALSAVVDSAGIMADVMLDGGVRRGTDVLKALALGAKAVFLGRPILWGLAVEGEQGVKRVLEILRDELDLAMALCGCRDIEKIRGDLLAT
ncbi:MAG: alpha-hydroxy-acid oxidizing protein [Candidatus Kapabacteria bacterium]|jgi:isopentenyl diphosphate isomerase/L-lactate dehydrogenase-like FMN-dependent dehydrogenase|nr:alpha-hydroxy-acid oxidizing protein [Candidatus Kapabacteria bacterium]